MCNGIDPSSCRGLDDTAAYTPLRSWFTHEADALRSGSTALITAIDRFDERRELAGCDCGARSIPGLTTSSVGLGCASALAQERHNILGKSLRDKDVRNVLLALEHYDPGVGQRGRHRLDVRFGWV